MFTGGPPEATGLLLITDVNWPEEPSDALLELVPEDWVIEVGGRRELDKARRPRLPRGLRVNGFGTVTDDGVSAAFFETLHFCPSCKPAMRAPLSRSSPGLRPGSREGGPVRCRCYPRRWCAPCARPATSMRRRALSSSLSPTTVGTPACRRDISMISCWSVWSPLGAVSSGAEPAAELSGRAAHRRRPRPPGPRILKVEISDYARNPEVDYAAPKKVLTSPAVRLRYLHRTHRGWKVTPRGHSMEGRKLARWR